jgi:hypothetical protein
MYTEASELVTSSIAEKLLAQLKAVNQIVFNLIDNGPDQVQEKLALLMDLRTKALDLAQLYFDLSTKMLLDISRTGGSTSSEPA